MYFNAFLGNDAADREQERSPTREIFVNCHLSRVKGQRSRVKSYLYPLPITQSPIPNFSLADGIDQPEAYNKEV
ncbi:MAG: hypothetical protein RMY34_25675 [Aulosira sp. DedQUE10]|nr:hypothetical protein [Aulosira sp. DedQUE10]